MFAHIKQFFAPPVFGDEDRTRMAKVLNTILVTGMLLLIFLGGVAVPFLFVEKLYNTLILLVLLLTLSVARWLMQHGHVRSASVLFVSTTWIVLTVFLLLAGGMTSIGAVVYVAFTAIAGLLLGTRAALIHAGACSLAGLVMVVLEAGGYALPRLFPMPAIVGWVDMTISLLLTATVLNLTLSNLNDALALARRRLEEREQTTESLRRSERRFRSLIEHTTDAVFCYEYDPPIPTSLPIEEQVALFYEGVLVECNVVSARSYGATQVKEVIGQKLTDLFGASPGSLDDFFAAFIQNGYRTVDAEAAETLDDGTERYYLNNGHGVIEDGVLLRVWGTFRDITDRKWSEQALQASERRYRDLFEGVPVGLYRTTPDGRILDANSALVEMLGHSDKASLLAASVPDGYVNLEDRCRWQTSMEQEGTVRGFEVQVRRHDGTAIWVRESAHTLRGQDGRVLYYEGSLEDISERKRAKLEREHLQQRLVQAQKMEAVGQLAGGIAHDFNNVLTAIQGYGNMLLDGLASDDPNDWPAGRTIRADLGEILKSADRAASLTRQLLAFSRKQVLHPRVLNLNDLLQGMEDMLRRLIGEDIDLTTVLAPDLDYVRADPGQIEQVIMNLSVNARDAMPRGGKLTFETANVELDAAYARTHPDVKPGQYALLAVSDSGTGMSDEVKAHIFEPFFTTKEQGQGTGLGLATVYGIVEQSGGQIEVYSEVGVGTTFKVYLPVTEAETRLAESAKAAEDTPSGTETVLLVEDEQSVRDLISRALGRCGYTLLVAGHPQEAMALSAEHAGVVHLLITDVVMPEMGGRELAERLVSLRPEMKVLYISGYTDDAIVRHGMLESGVAYLGKPFAPSRLAHKVREVLDAESNPFQEI
jgi:PAS domain S-box-containing protein